MAARFLIFFFNKKKKKKKKNKEIISNLRLTSASIDFRDMSRSLGSIKHANFQTFSSFSCISFELLSFLPSVYKTNVRKLSIPLHLKAIITIFRSGF